MLVYLSYVNFPKLCINKFAMLFIGPLFLIYIFHMYYSINEINIIYRSMGFVVFGFINIFIIPNTKQKEFFVYLLSRYPLIIGLIGMPNYLLSSDFSDLNLYQFPFSILFESAFLPRYSSILSANDLGTVALIGFSSSIIIYLKRPSYINMIVVVLSACILFLTQSRGSWAGAVAVVALCIGYVYFNNSKFQILVPVCLVFSILSYMILISNLSFFSQFQLSHRSTLFWQGINTFLANPLLGWGPENTGSHLLTYLGEENYTSSVHQTFLRFFINTGIIGGISYLLFSIWAIIRPHSMQNNPTIVIIAFGIFINMLFNEFSMFGVGLPSVLSAIIFGLLITNRDYF